MIALVASFKRRKWCKDNTFYLYPPNFLRTFFKKICFPRKSAAFFYRSDCKDRVKTQYAPNILRDIFREVINKVINNGVNNSFTTCQFFKTQVFINRSYQQLPQSYARVHIYNIAYNFSKKCLHDRNQHTQREKNCIQNFLSDAV